MWVGSKWIDDDSDTITFEEIIRARKSNKTITVNTQEEIKIPKFEIRKDKISDVDIRLVEYELLSLKQVNFLIRKYFCLKNINSFAKKYKINHITVVKIFSQLLSTGKQFTIYNVFYQKEYNLKHAHLYRIIKKKLNIKNNV